MWGICVRSELEPEVAGAPESMLPKADSGGGESFRKVFW